MSLWTLFLCAGGFYPEDGNSLLFTVETLMEEGAP